MNEPQPLAPAQKLFAFCERRWLRVLALLFLGVAVRLPALQGELIWDDHFLVSENPFIRSPLLALEAFRHFLFLDSLSLHYRPVQNVSYIVDYLFWNTDTTGYHLSNIFWHVGAGILLYLLLEKLFAELAPLSSAEATQARWQPLRAMPFIAAVLWTVHPAHSAAVDYISGRADSVAFVFAAGAWLLFANARTAKYRSLSAALYLGAMISALLALCARESACMWLLLFLVYLFVFDRSRSFRVKLVTFTGCLSVIGAYALLRHLPGVRPPVPATSEWPPLVRVVLMLRALGDYARVLFVPWNLHMERTVTNEVAYFSTDAWRRLAQFEYLSLLGAASGVVLIGVAWIRGKGRRLRACGAVWFFLGYLPISNLFSLNATVAEHWMYLPSIGIAIWACGCVIDFSPQLRRVAFAVSVLMLIGFSVRSAVRSSDWVNAETFFRRTLAAGGSGRAAVNLALVYSTRGEHEKAERVLRRVLQLNPDYAIARSNLASALYQSGKKEEAEKLLAPATRLPEDVRRTTVRGWISALNAAHLRKHDGDSAAALALAEQTRRDYPGVWDVICFEAELLRETQGPKAAIPLVEEFSRANWWHAGAAMALGRLYAEAGDASAAETALRHASRLDVHDAESLNLIAQMKLRQNNFADAFATQRRAVARQPDQPRQYLLLSAILEKMGRIDEAQLARTHFEQLQSLARTNTARRL